MKSLPNVKLGQVIIGSNLVLSTLIWPKIKFVSIFSLTYLYLPLFTYIWMYMYLGLITLIWAYLPLIARILPYMPYSPYTCICILLLKMGGIQVLSANTVWVLI